MALISLTHINYRSRRTLVVKTSVYTTSTLVLLPSYPPITGFLAILGELCVGNSYGYCELAPIPCIEYCAGYCADSSLERCTCEMGLCERLPGWLGSLLSSLRIADERIYCGGCGYGMFVGGGSSAM